MTRADLVDDLSQADMGHLVEELLPHLGGEQLHELICNFARTTAEPRWAEELMERLDVLFPNWQVE